MNLRPLILIVTLGSALFLIGYSPGKTLQQVLPLAFAAAILITILGVLSVTGRKKKEDNHRPRPEREDDERRWLG